MASIRVASPEDSKALAELAESTFRATFADSNTAADMDLHCQSSYGEAIQGAEIANPDLVTLVAEAGGQLIGFAQMKWGEGPACIQGQAPGEIQRLYVHRAWHGKGLAQELMGACLAAMEQRNSDPIWLGVWEKNPRAIAFYKKCGFVEVGEHTFPLGTDPQRDLVMARRKG